MRHTMLRGWMLLLVTLIALAIAAGPGASRVAAAEAKDNDPVGQAIAKAAAWLWSQQKNGKHWETVEKRDGEASPHDVKGGQWGGRSAMAVYGLLMAEVSEQDPRMKAAIEWLEHAEIIGTYAMGMKLQVWNSMTRLSPQQKEVLKRDAALLMNAVKTNGDQLGLYHYYLDPTKLSYDHSCSNYGVLGMWAAAQQNLEVPTKYWEIVDAAWRRNQHKDGAWSYQKNPAANHPGTMSMTSAGVATLFITQDYLHSAGRAECKGNIEDKDIEEGIKWLAAHYGDAKKGGHGLYALYNCERVGTASGLKYFGTVDWYKDGAQYLLSTQNANGGWGDVPQTVWGILFLVKGRAPIMFNKLQYALDMRGDKGTANWNQRHRDLANLARYTGKQLEKEHNWQIVNLKVNVADLHDAPILWISGNQQLVFSKEDKAKLKKFIDEGGLIVGHADCNAMAFNLSFQKLGQELYPAHEFRDLPNDHLIYNVQFKKATWNAFNPGLKGLSNGARELMVLIPAQDPSKNWQIQNFSSGAAKMWSEVAMNLYLYAIDKDTLNGKFKGQSYMIAKVASGGTKVKVARLDYGKPMWDPEPGGWERFDAYMSNVRKMDLQVEAVKLGTGKLSNDYKVAHLTGTAALALTDAQRSEIKKYVEGGGTLVVDACGGVVQFKTDAEKELNTIFGEAAAKGLGAVLPKDHKVYAAGGLTKVAYRAFTKRLLPGGTSLPRVRGIEVNNRTAVFYSPEDLSVGLVGMTIDGIYGYDPASATKIMESIVAYAMGAGAPPKPAAAAPQAAPQVAAKPAGTPVKQPAAKVTAKK